MDLFIPSILVLCACVVVVVVTYFTSGYAASRRNCKVADHNCKILAELGQAVGKKHNKMTGTILKEQDLYALLGVKRESDYLGWSVHDWQRKLEQVKANIE